MSKVYSWRKLNEKELTQVYLDEMRRDFPPTELKPLSMILNSEADGTAHTWGVFDGETLAAYLLMVRPAGRGCPGGLLPPHHQRDRVAEVRAVLLPGRNKILLSRRRSVQIMCTERPFAIFLLTDSQKVVR